MPYLNLQVRQTVNKKQLLYSLPISLQAVALPCRPTTHKTAKGQHAWAVSVTLPSGQQERNFPSLTLPFCLPGLHTNPLLQPPTHTLGHLVHSSAKPGLLTKPNLLPLKPNYLVRHRPERLTSVSENLITLSSFIQAWNLPMRPMKLHTAWRKPT